MNSPNGSAWPFDCPVDLDFDITSKPDNFVDLQQGSMAHLQERCGKICASDAAFALHRLARGGESETRRTYRMQILTEVLSGRPVFEKYYSRDMERGNELEPKARAAYEIHTGQLVETVGFVNHPTLPRCGSSPDGLVGRHGGCEFKCPRVTTHFKWIEDGIVPEKHRTQVIANMACTGRQWWDFSSFVDVEGLPEQYKLFTVRMERDEALIREYEDAVALLNSEVDQMIAFLAKTFHP